MKKILSVLGITAISMSLFGCQYFQPPTENVVDRQVSDEVVVDDASQETSLTITDEAMVGDDASQETSLTITDEADGGQGDASQEASLTIQ